MHMHDPKQEKLILSAISQLAKKEKKSVKSIKDLLLIHCDTDIQLKFWEIIDKKLPNNSFQYVGCCPCGTFELLEFEPIIFDPFNFFNNG